MIRYIPMLSLENALRFDAAGRAADGGGGIGKAINIAALLCFFQQQPAGGALFRVTLIKGNV